MGRPWYRVRQPACVLYTPHRPTYSSIRITPQRICDYLPSITNIRPAVGRYIRSFQRRETIYPLVVSPRLLLQRVTCTCLLIQPSGRRAIPKWRKIRSCILEVQRAVHAERRRQFLVVEFGDLADRCRRLVCVRHIAGICRIPAELHGIVRPKYGGWRQAERFLLRKWKHNLRREIALHSNTV